MRTVRARVVNGKVATRAKLPEGATLTVVVHDDEPEADLDERDAVAIRRNAAAIRAGKFVSGDSVRAFLRRRA